MRIACSLVRFLEHVFCCGYCQQTGHEAQGDIFCGIKRIPQIKSGNQRRSETIGGKGERHSIASASRHIFLPQVRYYRIALRSVCQHLAGANDDRKLTATAETDPIIIPSLARSTATATQIIHIDWRRLFGEAADQAIGFRERSAAFEDQAGYPVAK